MKFPKNIFLKNIVISKKQNVIFESKKWNNFRENKQKQ